MFVVEVENFELDIFEKSYYQSWNDAYSYFENYQLKEHERIRIMSIHSCRTTY